MNPRIAVVAAVMLFAGVARAASSAVPSDVESRLEHPRSTSAILDYTNCPTPQAQAKTQLEAVLNYPDQDRGAVVAKGSCAVSMNEPAPSKADDRYSIGE